MLVGEMEYEDILERKELTGFNGSIINNEKIGGELKEEYVQTYFIGTTHIMMTLFMFFMSTKCTFSYNSFKSFKTIVTQSFEVLFSI